MYYNCNQQKRSEVKEEARRLRRKFLRYQQAEIVYSLSHKKDIDQFSKMVDPYGYRDAVKNREENISKIYSDLQKGEEDYIRDWIQGVIDEEEPAEDVKEAAELLKRMDDLTERRARNPLTKVEELEEANYNQIDGMLNNSMVKDIVKSVNEGVRAFSIVERLELAKEQLSGEKSESKPLKDTVKKPEMGRD